MCSELNSTFIIIGANIYNQNFLEIHENHEKPSSATISSYRFVLLKISNHNNDPRSPDLFRHSLWAIGFYGLPYE